ncbi:MAG: nitroreductase family protein [Deltaproteobacteria bacterium]|nr:nitroreductase family protein [Deltaproteobacteria bacterium]MBW2121689.1 nitroreductase family protein [Deltaproteobacteria bacterium]
MNEILDAIKSRRTIRRFRGDPVPEETVRAVLDAGRWAQSFNNAQPWKFILIRDRETKKRLSDEAGKSVYYKGIAEAPVTIAICTDPEEDPHHWIEAGCNAHQNMALAAYSLGLGSSWIAVLDTDSEQPIKKVLGIPKNVRVLSLMPLGYPDENPTAKRKPLEEIVHYEKYGQKG